MDISTILTFLAGIALVGFGIIFDGTSFQISQLKNFYDFSSILITFGGTIAATLMSFPMTQIAAIPKQLKIILTKNRYNPQKYIEILVDFAQEARRRGILALEEKALEQKDKFLSNSVMLIVDAIEPEKAKEILENELDCLDDRHMRGCQVFDRASAFAPAFGMLGTLIGLINMLRGSNLSAEGGAGQMVAGMAIALITTFYGSLFANLLLVPIANKLRARHQEEMICKEIIMEGVLAIGAGDNPKHIEERLYAFLKTSERERHEQASRKQGSGRAV